MHWEPKLKEKIKKGESEFMAAAKKAKKEVKVKKELVSPKGWEAARLITGLFLIVFAVYTFISLLSFLFTWNNDQSLLSDPSLWNNSVVAENQGGKLGLIWANFLLSDLFGIGAFIVPFFLGGLAVYALRIKKINLVKFILLSIYGCVIVSISFSYIFTFTKYNDLFGTGVGGSYGYFVNDWLFSMLGATGAAAVILVALMLWLVMMSYSVVTWTNKLLKNIFKPEKEKKDDAAAAFAEDADLFESAAPAGAVAKGDPGSSFVPVDGVEMEIIQAPAPQASAWKDQSADGAVAVQENGQDEDDPEDFMKELSPEAVKTLFNPRLDIPNYQAPPVTLLNDYRDKWFEVPKEELEKNNRRIVKTLGDYKIGVEKIYARTGPTVTMYEVVPSAGVRVASIKRLEEDIAMSLAAKGVRIIAPIPGTNAVGIEVANEKPSIVSMRSMLEDSKFRNSGYELPVVLGRTISNEALSFDLTRMPHLLVAGATGQGKSIGLNVILASLLFTKHPAELKFVLVDPKKVELSLYQKIERHFLAKLPDNDDAIITDTTKVIYTLKSLCIEMEMRYDLLKMAKVRSIKEYNDKFLNRRLNPLKGHRFLPFIVVVIDEFADMLMTAGREIEEPMIRLAQKARSIGIHLVIATQRPSANIITGLIRSNFPARIAFRVVTSMDSKIILDSTGANQLIGRGDMLMLNGTDLTRVQCAYIDTDEIEKVTDFISAQQGYPQAHHLPEYSGEEGEGSSVSEVDLKRRDPMFDDAARLIVQYQQGSTSLIQRRMNLGYNRAGRIMDQLEAAGVVGPSEGSKARQVFIGDMATLEKLLATLD
jgi:S-DNA-T family DNA segregation ATPase FtsK/SpoIIIE